MRRLHLALPLLLAACSSLSSPKPVDRTTLAPLTTKELALLASGDAASRNKDPRSAEQYYLDATDLSRGHIDAHLALAEFYLEQDKTAEAKTILERAHALQPDHPRASYLLGKIAIQANKPDEALAYFNLGLDSAPRDVDLLNGAGIANDMLHNHPRAQALYQQAITLSPKEDLALAQTNLAMSYLLANEPKKAVALLKPLAKQPNASSVARHNLALAYGVLGKNSEAKALVSEDMTEEERTQALAQLEEYIAAPATEKPVIPQH